MRRPIIAANWKMNKTLAQAVSFVQEMRELVLESPEAEVVVIPGFAALATVAQTIKGSYIKLGAQDIFWQDWGPFTGEISPAMLKDVGCEFVLVGHSERRNYFSETDEMVNKKLTAALKAHLIPVLCIGETEQERDQGLTLGVLKRQLTTCLKGIALDSPSRLVVAYEPVWAIGTGRTATEEQAEEAQNFGRDLLSKLVGTSLAQEVRIIYGGSVTPENIAGLMGMPNVDGALVGGASLDATSFARIVMAGKGKSDV